MQPVTLLKEVTDIVNKEGGEIIKPCYQQGIILM
jgi:hypothetical protein